MRVFSAPSSWLFGPKTVTAERRAQQSGSPIAGLQQLKEPCSLFARRRAKVAAPETGRSLGCLSLRERASRKHAPSRTEKVRICALFRSSCSYRSRRVVELASVPGSDWATAPGLEPLVAAPGCSGGGCLVGPNSRGAATAPPIHINVVMAWTCSSLFLVWARAASVAAAHL
jgi:hypothetical protein